MIAIAVLLGAFLLGAVPFGLLLTRAAGLPDIRRTGSGNIGMTNVLRTGRRDLAALTLVLDAGKGAAAVLVGQWLGGGSVLGGAGLALAAGLAAVLGHMYPPWLGFRGGKGVATGLGALLACAWPIGLAACATWLLAAAIFRYSSAASLAAFCLAPAYAMLVSRWRLMLMGVVMAAFVVLRHRANIERLLAGTEPRFGAPK